MTVKWDIVIWTVMSHSMLRPSHTYFSIFQDDVVFVNEYIALYIYIYVYLHTVYMSFIVFPYAIHLNRPECMDGL